VPDSISKKGHSILRTIIFTSLSLIAFAANSVLCRLALAENPIDAAGFTIIRLLSGAIVLLLIINLSKKDVNKYDKGSWAGGLMLFLYAVAFSFAYVSLDTGTGALILFGAVQITMIFWSVLKGNRLHLFEWAGAIIAFGGFVYLVLPGVTAPSLIGFILMTTSGIAWGIYSIIGRSLKNPIYDTAYNFIKTIPFIIILLIIFINHIHYSFEGILLAIISGGITSGIGYILWYIALGGLTATQAAVVQLLVPVIAAFGGVIFISESVNFRLIISAIFVFGGILLVTYGRNYNKKRTSAM
jgi:drug/metabolite transporter (DMT)-like permease